MALNTLTLTVTQGVQGRGFRSKINGITAGNDVTLDLDAAPGFGINNGVLRHASLPYSVNTVAIRERNPATGETKVTRIEIAGATAAELLAQAAAQVTPPRVVRSFRMAAEPTGDGSFVFNLYVENDLGSTTVVEIVEGGGGGSSLPAMTRFAPALAAAKAGTGRCIIMDIGDSTTAGKGAGTSTGAWVGARTYTGSQILTNLLAAAAYPAIHDFVMGDQNVTTVTANQYNPKVNRTAAWDVLSGAAGKTLGGSMPRNNSSGGIYDFTPASQVDTFDVWLLTGPTYPTVVNVAINEVIVDTFSAYSASIAVVKKTYSTTLGIRKFGIARTGAEGSTSLYIIGIRGFNSAAAGQVEVWNAGWSGEFTSDAIYAVNAWSSLKMIELLRSQVDLFRINLGINDWYNTASVVPATTAANLSTLIDTCRVTSDVVLTIPFPSDLAAGNNSANQVAYQDAIRGVAAAKNVRTIDLPALFGTWAAANAAGYAYDNGHPSASGYALIGQEFYDVIMAA